MKNKFEIKTLLRTLIVVHFFTTAHPAFSDAGHDHGEQVQTSTAVVSPRFAMHSEQFEAVGIVNDNALEIYIDRAGSNEPVAKNTSVKLELNGAEVPVQQHGQGLYGAALPENSGEEIAVSMSITDGENTELLAGELQMGHMEDAHPQENHSHSQTIALYGGCILLVWIAAFIGFNRRKSQGDKS